MNIKGENEKINIEVRNTINRKKSYFQELSNSMNMLESKKKISILNINQIKRMSRIQNMDEIKGIHNIAKLLSNQNKVLIMVLKQIRIIDSEYLQLTHLYYAKNLIKQKIRSLFLKLQNVLK